MKVPFCIHAPACRSATLFIGRLRRNARKTALLRNWMLVVWPGDRDAPRVEACRRPAQQFLWCCC